MTKLSQEDIDKCREAFESYDKDGSGRIDMWELRGILNVMGQDPTEEQLFQMVSEVDDDGSGCIEFSQFLKVIAHQKAQSVKTEDDTDTIDAFVAMGGNGDKTGQISVDKLVKTIKDFGLTIDIEQLISGVYSNHSGYVDFEEFKRMLTEK